MAFLGNNFQWFVGVVEDRMDPEHLGRLRVRCLGLHTSNKDAIATADLRGRLYHCLLQQVAYLVSASRLLLL